MDLPHNITLVFLDQDRNIPIPGILVHLSFQPEDRLPVYFSPRLTDQQGTIQIQDDELQHLQHPASQEPGLFFCDLPDTRKINRFEIRVLNQGELQDDLDMKRLFSAEIAARLGDLIERSCNKAFMGRKILCDPQTRIEIHLTPRP